MDDRHTVKPGDRVKDGGGKHVTVVRSHEYISLELATLARLEIVDRAAYGALNRAAKSLADVYGCIPHMAYSLLFDVLIRVIGCDATELARAVLVERMA